MYCLYGGKVDCWFWWRVKLRIICIEQLFIDVCQWVVLVLCYFSQKISSTIEAIIGSSQYWQCLKLARWLIFKKPLLPTYHKNIECSTTLGKWFMLYGRWLYTCIYKNMRPCYRVCTCIVRTSRFLSISSPPARPRRRGSLSYQKRQNQFRRSCREWESQGDWLLQWTYFGDDQHQ